jgi:hypothetical protein
MRRDARPRAPSASLRAERKSCAPALKVAASPLEVVAEGGRRAAVAALEAWLREETGEPWRVVVTTNRARLASVARPRGVATLRVVERLLDSEAWPDILAYVRENCGQAVVRLRDRVESETPFVPVRWLPCPRHEAHHPLALHTALVVERYFAGQSPAAVSWACGPQIRGSSQLSLELGCYIAHENRALIDPRLDHGAIPFHYLHFVIYHELLHARFESQGHAGHWVHDAKFREAEAKFEHFAEVSAYERSLLPRVLMR